MRRDVAPGRALSALTAVFAAAALLAATPAPAAAQAPEADPSFSVSLRGGFSSPKGDLADLADDGQLLALALGYRVSPRVTLLVEGSLENLEKGGGGQVLQAPVGPSIDLWRVMALASVELTEPGASRWEVAVQAGGGPTVMDASAFVASEAITTVEPTLMAGVVTGYDLSRRLTAFVRGGGSIWFDAGGQDDGNYFGKEVTLTHTLGLRVRF